MLFAETAWFLLWCEKSETQGRQEITFYDDNPYICRKFLVRQDTDDLTILILEKLTKLSSV